MDEYLNIVDLATCNEEILTFYVSNDLFVSLLCGLEYEMSSVPVFEWRLNHLTCS